MGGITLGVLSDRFASKSGLMMCSIGLAVPIVYSYTLVTQYELLYAVVPLTGVVLSGTSHFLTVNIPASIAAYPENKALG